MTQRKSHRYIDGAYFFWHCIKHNGGLFKRWRIVSSHIRHAGRCEPLRIQPFEYRHDGFGLTECRRDGHYGNVGVEFHFVKPCAVARRECLDISAYKPRRPVSLDIHRRRSIVPIEVGYAHALHRPEYRLLGF